jgi:hypothetical protein
MLDVKSTVLESAAAIVIDEGVTVAVIGFSMATSLPPNLMYSLVGELWAAAKPARQRKASTTEADFLIEGDRTEIM